MSRKWIKRAAIFVCQIVVITALLMMVSIVSKGMYLFGIPNIEDVQKVVIDYPEMSDQTLEITDFEQIELSVKLTGFLRYSLFDKANLSDEPKMTFTYYLSNGKSVCVSASENTVWWKGKAYSIKDEQVFINLAEGIFFYREAVKRAS